jgi:hypothetical protein
VKVVLIQRLTAAIKQSVRHKIWKAFATLQCSTKVVPPKSSHPNFKVDPFLAHMQKVSMAAWDCGANLSGDEKTIGFKGNHMDKQRINYKHEGDGFLPMLYVTEDTLIASSCAMFQTQNSM